MSRLVDTPPVRVEAVEAITEAASAYGLFGQHELTLVIDGLTTDEWEAAGGRMVAPRLKVEVVGPHAIQYLKGDDQR